MSAGETVFLIVQNTGSTPLEVTAKVSDTKEEANVPKMITGGKVDSVNQGDWYGFTAPSDGMYEFRLIASEGISVDSTGYLYGKYINGYGTKLLKSDTINTVDSSWSSLQYILRAGETVWLELGYGNWNSDINVGLSVNCIYLTEILNLDSKINVAAMEKQYYIFTAPEAGRYNFEIKATRYFNANVIIYPLGGYEPYYFDSDGGYDDQGNYQYVYYRNNVYINKGETYYIEQDNYDLPEDGFTVSVTASN